jgi:hypothetical protein
MMLSMSSCTLAGSLPRVCNIWPLTTTEHLVYQFKYCTRVQLTGRACRASWGINYGGPVDQGSGSPDVPKSDIRGTDMWAT